MGDYSWIGPLISGVAKGANSSATADSAQGISDAAYAQMLANLRERMGDYDKLGTAGYKDISAQQLGPSALEGIQSDPAARAAQQQSMAALQQLADNGGLSISDVKALNDLQSNLNRSDSARRNALSNQYAARGQLGSGAQLAMELQGQQQAAQSANQRGESIAAQAQDRALQAILQKGQVARGMSNDDYGRKADAAKARDAIESRNAAARTGASQYNNSLRGQAYEDALAQARGKSGLTDSMNQTIFGQAKSQGNTVLAKGGYRNDLIDQGSTLLNKGTSGSSGGSPGGRTDTGDGGGDDEINLNDD